MLNYKTLDHSDDFGTEVICLVEVTGVPERFVDEAKRIDGENYSDDGFGVCIQYDRDNEEYFAVEDTDFRLYQMEPQHQLPRRIYFQHVHSYAPCTSCSFPYKKHQTIISLMP